MKSTSTLSSLVAVAMMALAGPTHALNISDSNLSCAASSTLLSQPGYVSCLGAFSGNIDNQLNGASGAFATINSAFSFSTNQYFSSEKFAAAGNPFAEDAGALDNGRVRFDQALTGKFVLGIKQGNAFSLYLFNAENVAGVSRSCSSMPTVSRPAAAAPFRMRASLARQRLRCLSLKAMR